MVVLLVTVPGCKRFTLYIMSACSDELIPFFISHLDFMVLFSFSAPLSCLLHLHDNLLGRGTVSSVFGVNLIVRIQVLTMIQLCRYLDHLDQYSSTNPVLTLCELLNLLCD
jgi:hypothetical protein